MNTSGIRRRVRKDAEGGAVERALAALWERLVDMPLRKGRVAKAMVVFGTDRAFLQLHNLEHPVVWELGLPRLAVKADGPTRAAGFDPLGTRYVNSLLGGVAASPVEKVPEGFDAGPGGVVDGAAEFGLQTPDDHEYFLSKWGDLVGIVRVARKADGGWVAKLAKESMPRVLSPDAVAEGLMPPLGHSALPVSLERVVPPEYQYWKARDVETAKAARDALVESSFFNTDCVKAVDGELRKVEVKYFLYEPEGVVAADATKRVAKAAPLSLADKFTGCTPPTFRGRGFNPFEAEDWLEELDKQDATGTLAILSPTTKGVSARALARACAVLKGDWLIHTDDSRVARDALGDVGVVFKLAGEGALFASSWAPRGGFVHVVAKAEAKKTVSFQGLAIKIDRPKGFVQTGKDAEGHEWTREYTTDYGFIPKTHGGDGEELDVFVGPDLASPHAYLIKQKNAEGAFDEFKLMVGFPTPRDARDMYLAHVPARFFDGMEEVNLDLIKSLLNTPHGNAGGGVLEGGAVPPPPPPATGVPEGVMLKVAKTEQYADERYVLGIVLEPDVVDSQHDTYSADEVRQASERFMQDYRNMGLMHKQVVNDDVKILENYIAPVDMRIGDEMVKKGTWLMAVRVLGDDMWRAVKSGGLTGFSIGGSAVRKPVAAGGV